MAEALFQRKLQQLGRENEIEVRSAGLWKFRGTSTSRNTITVLAEYGITCNHHPQEITPELIEWADLVLTMTQCHQWMTTVRFPKCRFKTFTLKAFVGESRSINIADPVGRSLEKYRQCAQDIDRTLDRLLAKLAANP